MPLREDGPQRLALRYGRMSFDDTDEQLRRQAEDVDAICDLHDYLSKPEWLFTEEDESGNEDTRHRQKKGERPGLKALDAELHALTKAGHAVTVVAWVPSRLFRDAGHKETYFRKWARAGDVRVHTKQGVWNPKDPRDRFVSTVVAGADQYYSDDVREKVVRAHDERIANGLPATGWPGFGHRLGDDGGWREKKGEADLLRSAIDRILAGTTLSTIVDEFNENDVPTRLGGTWRITTLRRVLMSPRMAGILVRGGAEVGPSEYIDALIPEPKWRQLCKVIEGRKRGPRRGRQLLTGVLFCSSCESNLNSDTSKLDGDLRYRRYGCRKCGGSNLKAEVVEEVVVDRMFVRLNDPRFFKALSKSDKDADRLLRELAAQEAELDALAEAADRLPVRAFVAKSDSITAKIEDLKNKLNATASLTAASPWIGKADRLRKAWGRMTTDEQREVILNVVGPLKVLPPPRMGQRATREFVEHRLVPLR